MKKISRRKFLSNKAQNNAHSHSHVKHLSTHAHQAQEHASREHTNQESTLSTTG